MAFLGKYGTSALKYYQTIIGAAYQNLNTADMWTAIRSTMTSYGLPTPQTQPPDVSTIRGYANRIVNGAHTLWAASNSDTITRDMMAYAPYSSRDQQSIDTEPVYSVKYQVVWEKPDGTVSTRWNTSIFTKGNFPTNVGDLREKIIFNADELIQQANQTVGGESGGQLLGTGAIEITLV